MARSRHDATRVLSWAVLAGCAQLPGVPVGPSVGPSVRVGMTAGYAYGPATARLRGPGGTWQQEGNAANHGSRFPSPLPQRLTARFSTGSWLDVGADIGWTDRALQLRAGPLHAARPLPGGVELEWRVGSTSTFAQDAVVERAQALRARVELYPPLPFGRTEDGLPRAFGVLAAGMSQGRHLLTLAEYGADLQSFFYSNAGLMKVLRTETRLELALGLHWRSLPVTSTLVLLPWLTVGRRQAEVSCTDCVNVELERLSASWGVALAVDAGVLFRTAD